MLFRKNKRTVTVTISEISVRFSGLPAAVRKTNSNCACDLFLGNAPETSRQDSQSDRAVVRSTYAMVGCLRNIDLMRARL